MEVKEIRWRKVTKLISCSQWLIKINSTDDDDYRVWRQTGPFRTQYWFESRIDARTAAYIEPPRYLDLVELACALVEYIPNHHITWEGNDDHHVHYTGKTEV